MGGILNITNGDSAVKVMRETGVAGEFLPWRDVLHEGPVPGELPLDALSKRRARFIAEQGWGDPERIVQSFMERDRLLGSAGRFEKLLLWFEHDLYDQLQLLQILDLLANDPPADTEIGLICTENYLGPLSPDELLGLQRFERPVTDEQLRLASRVWSAFRQPTPERLQALIGKGTGSLPFLDGALVRLLEEYPACGNGLSRTARVALEILAQGSCGPFDLFSRYQESEERRFLGDASFWLILRAFLDATPAILVVESGGHFSLPPDPQLRLSLSSAGRELLDGTRDWRDIHPLDRWIGGVHLAPANNWCLNPDGLLVGC